MLPRRCPPPSENQGVTPSVASCPLPPGPLPPQRKETHEGEWGVGGAPSNSHRFMGFMIVLLSYFFLRDLFLFFRVKHHLPFY